MSLQTIGIEDKCDPALKTSFAVLLHNAVFGSSLSPTVSQCSHSPPPAPGQRAGRRTPLKVDKGLRSF